MLTLYFDFINQFMYSRKNSEFFRFSIQKIISSVNIEGFISTFLFCTFLIYFISLASIVYSVLNRNQERSCSCIVPGLRDKAYRLSLLNIVLTVGYHRYYCQVVEFPFIPNLPRVYRKLMFLFFQKNAFFASIDRIFSFFISSVNMMNHIQPAMNYWNEFHFLMYYPL